MGYWWDRMKPVVGPLDKNHRRNERIKATMILDLQATHTKSYILLSLAKAGRGRLSDCFFFLVSATLNGKTNPLTGEVYEHSAYYKRMMRKAKRRY